MNIAKRMVLGVLMGISVGGAFIGFGRAYAGGGQGGDESSPDRHRSTPLDLFNTEGLLIPRGRIFPGGPPKDGIPALVDPQVVPVAEADFLRPDDRVIGVTVNGESRAYPIGVLNWHEIINDHLGAKSGRGALPIAVVYCPLCDSVSVVDRRFEGKAYEFGVSGLLFNSNVLLYDRTDQALWSQVGLTAVSGPHAGRALRHLDGWELTAFEAWKAKHPASTVVSFDTGHRRNYTRNPYGRYFQSDRLIFPAEPADGRFKNKTKIVGIRFGQTTRAYPLEELKRAPGGEVLDVIQGQAVRLRADPATGAIHIVQAPDGAQVIHTFWFAWAAFHPETRVYRYTPEQEGVPGPPAR